MRTFFTMEGGDSEFANFTLPTLKAFFEARSHNVSGNNNLLLMLYDAPKCFFFPAMNWQSSGEPKNDAKTLFVHPPAPFHGNFCNCNSNWHLYCFAILISTSTVIHGVKQHLLRNRPGSALQPLATSFAKDYKARSL